MEWRGQVCDIYQWRRGSKIFRRSNGGTPEHAPERGYKKYGGRRVRRRRAYHSAAPSKALQVVTAAPGNADADAVLTMPQTVTLANAPDNFTVKNFAYNKVSKTLAITTTSANGTVILVTVGETPSLAYKETVTAGFEVSDSEFTLKGDYLFLSKKGTGNNDGGVWRYKVSSNVASVSVMGTAVINAGHDLQFAAD